jgi:DNA-binding transcriptional LysR family regulator
MDTDGLRLFVLAAEMLNISAAGRRLGIGPAVAGARLTKLEKQVGCELLHRSTRKVSLSTEGAEFLPFAREILAQETAAMAALGHGGHDPSGTLRFALPSSFAQCLFVPLLPKFLDLYPHINLELSVTDMVNGLPLEEYDLVLRGWPPVDGEIEAHELGSDNWVLCATPDYLARYGTPAYPEDLMMHRLLDFSGAQRCQLTCLNQTVVSSYPPAQSKARVSFDHMNSLRLAALAGAGIALTSLCHVREDLEQGRLVNVLPDYTVGDGAGLWMVCTKSSYQATKTRALMDFLLREVL